ncbi:5-formyltetrahydrofolate cyclo-ligase [Pseudoflavonifractor sp. AF19-9AC]|uniref:5-formyltetrahydrofolate cyclo-ligase n=1 Tax=Pseudoflavonifractor sp. AF19-9AC TaxID=2292244 RepID=UPI000E49B2F9|nr:5-formyltetrahydrofolate cyclo-ligase [Pseudoflavonifractor sp. AF19-9AC]RHR11022.1 5-formyltetrahydrofolate cyclo-ligase [Pseudoflavonifractor sp. AF19-9AC]
MPFTPDQEKKELRRQVRSQLASLEAEQLRREDDAMFARFLALPQMEKAKTIFAFWGIPGREPETGRLVQELTALGKRVGLPRMLPEHQMEVRLYDPNIPMHSVAFGIQEPGEDCPLIAREEIDLILVPAVCYDRQGYRLGFGGGYYDRWLEHFSGYRVGLCRSCILQDHVPTEAHDTKVDTLITELECLSLG